MSNDMGEHPPIVGHLSDQITVTPLDSDELNVPRAWCPYHGRPLFASDRHYGLNESDRCNPVSLIAVEFVPRYET